MKIVHPPKVGQILVCDFKDPVDPEIGKVRPVIVVAPRLPHRPDLATIVPISTTAPIHEHPFCYKLSKNYHPKEPDDLDCWAKADLVMSVSYKRLSPFKVDRRKYVYPTLTADDLLGVRHAILHGLGLYSLIGSE